MDQFEQQRALEDRLRVERLAARPRVDGPAVARVARELRAVGGRPSTSARRRGPRAAMPRRPRAEVGQRARGVRPDGRPVTLAEKQAILARFGRGWSIPPVQPGPQASAGLPSQLPPGHASPYGW